MNLLDLLPPISPNAPCGPDPEEGSDFGPKWSEFGVLRDALSKEWTEYRLLSQTNRELRPPDSLPLQTAVFELALKTKHLRLAVALAECLTHTGGLAGLRDGLLLITAWCATWWPKLHPGGTDPADIELRAEIIENLNNERTLKRFHGLPLVEAADTRGTRKVITAGPFSLQDYAEASEAAPTDPERAQLVLQTFANGDAALKESNLAAVRGAREAAVALVELFQAKGRQLSLGKLIDFIDRLLPLLRGGAPAGPSAAPGPAGARPAAGGGATFTGVASREAAAAALDSVALYFRSAEPSSPIPYLVQRAQRCIGRNYLEIIEELGADRVAVDLALKPQS
ncbi:MAG TPA: type VI secretion system ImpA family N-terminal domain-containing protein [Chthoniobacteraceae bacterium]|jgi:type VI secretion system protein ImpA|nr:type VI secretion system ImpA family N-terminal domain-containing protein [Chthoniobacteraceae bacterium]